MATPSAAAAAAPTRSSSRAPPPPPPLARSAPPVKGADSKIDYAALDAAMASRTPARTKHERAPSSAAATSTTTATSAAAAATAVSVEALLKQLNEQDAELQRLQQALRASERQLRVCTASTDALRATGGGRAGLLAANATACTVMVSEADGSCTLLLVGITVAFAAWLYGVALGYVRPPRAWVLAARQLGCHTCCPDTVY